MKNKTWIFVIIITLLLIISYLFLRHNYIKLGLISYGISIFLSLFFPILEIYNIFKVEKSKQVFKRDEGSYTILGYKPFMIKFYREKNPVYFWMGILVLCLPFIAIIFLSIFFLYNYINEKIFYILILAFTIIIIIAILLFFRAILAFKSSKKS